MFGLNFLENQEKELVRKIGLAADEQGFSSVSSFVQWLSTTDLTLEQSSKLATFLTIGETYFMRERKAFDFLSKIYLPGLISKRHANDRRLNIWCAGCATGEEAYSLAITLFQLIPDIEDWNISIVGTDINANSLAKAKEGIYTKWSFRSTTEDFKHNYFTSSNGVNFEVKDSIKKLVKIKPFNLAMNSYESVNLGQQPFDIIFCRNVLIYFSNDSILSTTNKFYSALGKGGILVVSPVEVTNLISPKFETITYAGFTIYHKGAVPKENKAYESQSANEPTIQKQETTTTAFNNNWYKPEPIDKTTFKEPEKKQLDESLLTKTQQQTTLPYQEQKSEAIDLPTTKPEVKDWLAQAKLKANDGFLVEAEMLCEKAIEQNKLNPASYYLFATILQEQGNDEKAMQHLKRAIYLDPRFVLAHFLYGTLVAKNGNLASGRKSFKSALSILSNYKSDDIIPESEGITAGRFKEILQSIAD